MLRTHLEMKSQAESKILPRRAEALVKTGETIDQRNVILEKLNEELLKEQKKLTVEVRKYKDAVENLAQQLVGIAL